MPAWVAPVLDVAAASVAVLGLAYSIVRTGIVQRKQHVHLAELGKQKSM